MFIVLIILAMITLDALWWRRADILLRPLRRGSLWRRLLGLFMGGQIFILLWVIIAGRQGYWPPMHITTAAYVWHLCILPLTAIAWILIDLVATAVRIAKTIFKPATPAPHSPTVSITTRRQFLSASAALVPPIVLAGATGAALGEVDAFRVRRLSVPIASLPPALDGMTIAHVSDVHVGRFTTPAMLDQIVRTVNGLRADLIAFTGDLINLSITELPQGLDLLHRLQSRAGVFVCEGNHDLMHSRSEFEQTVKKSGLPLLLDETATVRINNFPVQVLGLRWSRSQAALDQSVQNLLAQRRSAEFPILLAHHPHTFDPAAAAGLPLTLSGHTHGGQLMLTDRIGCGPVLFRYISGLYRRGNSALVVSNGVGNWFPLRINAPAEIIHLTLRRP